MKIWNMSNTADRLKLLFLALLAATTFMAQAQSADEVVADDAAIEVAGDLTSQDVDELISELEAEEVVAEAVEAVAEDVAEEVVAIDVAEDVAEELVAVEVAEDVAEAELIDAVEPEEDVEEQLVSLDLKGGRIEDVIYALSRDFNRNIVVGPEVTGEVRTIHLKNVPWEDALEVVLSPHGYGYQTRGETIVVSSLEKMQKKAQIDPLVTRVFELKYLDAFAVSDLIKKQLSARGKFSVLSPMMRKGWEEGDSTSSSTGGAEVNIAAKVLSTVSKADAENDRLRSKTLVVQDVRGVIESIEEIVQQVDVMPRQILIEARFIEVSVDALQDMGLEFGTGAEGATSGTVDPILKLKGGENYGSGISSVNQVPGSAMPSGDINSNYPYNTGMTLMFQQLTGNQFQVLLHLLESDTDSNVLSAPRVLAMNNNEATIMVGEKFPIVSSEVSGNNGSVSTSLDYYQDIGIQLNVIPQICENDIISMMVNPMVTRENGTVSGSVGSGADAAALTSYPLISTREAETQIVLQNGQTAVIGGLITDSEVKGVQKVPFLGDIPLLGRLFRRDTTSNEKQDLLIFITATIIDPMDDPMERRLDIRTYDADNVTELLDDVAENGSVPVR